MGISKKNDPYLNELLSIERLVKEWVKHKSLIIAYDYDNTVYDYHNLGLKFDAIISLLQECRDLGGKFIVYTHSPSERHLAIKNYLNTNNIPFDAINENIVSLHDNSGKLFYNIFLDDRAGLKSAYSILHSAMTVMRESPNDEAEACKILRSIYGKRVNC